MDGLINIFVISALQSQFVSTGILKQNRKVSIEQTFFELALTPMHCKQCIAVFTYMCVEGKFLSCANVHYRWSF